MLGKFFVNLFLFFCFSAAFAQYPDRQIKIFFTGQVSTTGLQVDLKKIETDFKPVQMVTVTPYEKGVFTFEGVFVDDFIKKYAKNSDYSRIKLKAIDGYVVEWSKEEIQNFRPLIAYKINNKYIDRKDKGTFRLVMDYSRNKPLDEKKYTPKWIWQINEIEIH